MKFRITLAWIQGIYFLITGIWPLLHMKSFLIVTGPKTDLWLVETLGILISAIASGIILAAVKKEVTLPVVLIAGFSAAGMAFIDITYVLKGEILPVYLIDAIPEIGFVICWIIIIGNNAYKK